MERRQVLERIIIGTLLESNKLRNYYDDCRCCITADMFTDDLCGRIYGIIAEMNAAGKIETDPCSIFDAYGDKVLDIVSDMCELCNDYSFVHKKAQYNKLAHIISEFHGIEPRYTDVQFDAYVNEFIQKVFYEERESEGNRRGQSNAA